MFFLALIGFYSLQYSLYTCMWHGIQIKMTMFIKNISMKGNIMNWKDYMPSAN